MILLKLTRELVFVSKNFYTKSCRVMFFSKFWNECNTKLELCRINYVLSFQSGLIMFKLENILVFTRVITCLLGSKCNLVYRAVSCFRWVMFVFHINNTISFHVVFASYYSLLYCILSGSNTIQKHKQLLLNFHLALDLQNLIFRG